MTDRIDHEDLICGTMSDMDVPQWEQIGYYSVSESEMYPEPEAQQRGLWAFLLDLVSEISKTCHKIGLKLAGGDYLHG